MKKMIKRLSFIIVCIGVVSGCSTKNPDDLFTFKDSYVGDNSAVLNMINHLQEAKHLSSFELETKEQPYGIILNYDWSLPKQDSKKTVMYNATFLFTFIKNVEWITFNFDNQTYTITKENLQSWYGEDFSKVTSEDELKTLIQKHVNDTDKVNQLFNSRNQNK